MGVHYQTAYRWVRSGELVAVKVGAGYEISEAALERFQAQRAAMERVPAMLERDAAAGLDPVADALVRLEELIQFTTVDASAVYQRAAHALSSTLGDAAIVSLREADGSLRLAAFDHRDPERGVLIGAMLRFGALDEPMYRVVPPTPAKSCWCHKCRNARCGHRYDRSSTSASRRPASTAPSARRSSDPASCGGPCSSRATLRAGRTRSTTATSWCRSRRASAPRWPRPSAVMRLGHCAPDLPPNWPSGSTTATSRARGEWLQEAVADEDPVALTSLDTTVDAATTAFADLFGTTVPECKERSVCDLVDPAYEVQDTFERLRGGEFDFCTVVTRPVLGDTRAVVLDGAIVRQPDATPCCVLYVAHAVPEVVSVQGVPSRPGE